MSMRMKDRLVYLLCWTLIVGGLIYMLSEFQHHHIEHALLAFSFSSFMSMLLHAVHQGISGARVRGLVKNPWSTTSGDPSR